MDSRSGYTGCLISPDIAILQASFEYWLSSADTSPVNVVGRDLNAWAIVFVPLGWQASWLLVLGRGLAWVFWSSRGKREIWLAPPVDGFCTHHRYTWRPFWNKCDYGGYCWGDMKAGISLHCKWGGWWQPWGNNTCGKGLFIYTSIFHIDIWILGGWHPHWLA